jgi:hypothetical protein
MEKARESFQAVEEKSRSLSRFENEFRLKKAPKSLLFGKCIIPNLSKKCKKVAFYWLFSRSGG